MAPRHVFCDEIATPTPEPKRCTGIELSNLVRKNLSETRPWSVAVHGNRIRAVEPGFAVSRGVSELIPTLSVTPAKGRALFHPVSVVGQGRKGENRGVSVARVLDQATREWMSSSDVRALRRALLSLLQELEEA